MSIGNKARPTSSELKKPGSVVVGRKQSAIATPIKYEAAQIPVPKASSINYDLEKAMQKNPENDKVGVIVEIPERSMREMLPVILTFFCILTCLVPIDIFLALSVMNYKDPVPQQVTQAITSSESQVEAHLLKKRSYDLEALGADSNKNVSTSPENWCERSAEISSNVFTITYDLGKVQRFLDRPLIYAMVYSPDKEFLKLFKFGATWTLRPCESQRRIHILQVIHGQFCDGFRLSEIADRDMWPAASV
ncbi:uncharacterized protein LOC111251230 isoform X5 [Varroa destructor]|nr:uncharacterized protein LOC111251230 isoform X5 [Varroa destructor]